MTSNSPRSDRILGSLRAEDGKGIARFEDRYSTAIDDLWSALTDAQRLAHWYGEVEGDLRLGGDPVSTPTGNARGALMPASRRSACWSCCAIPTRGPVSPRRPSSRLS